MLFRVGGSLWTVAKGWKEGGGRWVGRKEVEGASKAQKHKSTKAQIRNYFSATIYNGTSSVHQFSSSVQFISSSTLRTADTRSQLLRRISSKTLKIHAHSTVYRNDTVNLTVLLTAIAKGALRSKARKKAIKSIIYGPTEARAYDLFKNFG